MDEQVIDNIKEFVLEPDETISDIETCYNSEGDYVVSYVQDGQKKIIMIDYTDKKGDNYGDKI